MQKGQQPQVLRCMAYALHAGSKPIPAHCLEKWRRKTQDELKLGKHE